jgi:hypothetical protein
MIRELGRGLLLHLQAQKMLSLLLTPQVNLYTRQSAKIITSFELYFLFQINSYKN